MDLLAKANSSTKAKPSIKPKKEEKKPNLLDKALKNEKVKKPTEDVKKSVKKTKKLAIASTKSIGTSTKKEKKGRVFAFVGKHGTGKTFACGKFAEKWKKTLYLDTEYKASEILDEQCPDLKYDMKEPIKDENKKHSQIFKDS